MDDDATPQGDRMTGSQILEATWRYWSALRRGATVPARSALSPSAMTGLVGHAMVLDRVRPGVVRIRLSGRHLDRLLGMDVRGLPMRAFFDPADRPRSMAEVEAVFHGPATVEMDLIAQTQAGLITGRMLILPLRDARDEITKALAVLVTDQPAAITPCRFQLTKSSTVLLDTRTGPVTPQKRRSTDYHLPVEVEAGLAERPTPFKAGPVRRGTRVPWLHVID